MQEASKSRTSGWLKHRPPTGLAGAAFWLALWFCVLFLLRKVPGAVGTFFTFVQIFVGVALVVVAIPLAWRLVRRHMLWSLRNKLVLTYLLIGLAPVVLFLTLVLISAYVAAGQFAIHLADSRMQAALNQLSGENAHRTELVARLLDEKRTPGAEVPGGDSTGRAGCFADEVTPGHLCLHEWGSVGARCGEWEGSIGFAGVGVGVEGRGVPGACAGRRGAVPGCLAPDAIG